MEFTGNELILQNPIGDPEGALATASRALNAYIPAEYCARPPKVAANDAKY
jgi:hypothetical protein